VGHSSARIQCATLLLLLAFSAVSVLAIQAAERGGGRVEPSAGESTSAEPERLTDFTVASYDVYVDVSPEKHQLKIKDTIQLGAQEDKTGQLSFRLKKEFKVGRVMQDGSPLRFDREDQQGEEARTIVEGVQAGPSAAPLILEYEGTFTQPYRYDAMPAVIVYDDEVRVTKTSVWLPRIRASGPKPKARLTVEIPEGFWVVSGDRLINDPRPSDGRVRFVYESESDGCGSFCAARYERIAIPWGDKTIEACYFPEKPDAKPTLVVRHIAQDKEDILTALETAKNIIRFYSDTFCPYPAQKFTLAQKGAYSAYGYSVRTYIVMNDYTDFHERTMAHEIAHQWWGNLVGMSGKATGWLTESLAEYSAFLYMEHAHGRQSAVTGDKRDSLLKYMMTCTPIGQAGFNAPDYGNIAYHIGPHVYHMLRYVVGDEDFFATLKSFAKQRANRSTNAEDFIAVAESVHGKSLEWFFEAWLERTKGPRYVLEHEVADLGGSQYSVRGKVIQEETDYRMPLKIEIAGAGQTTVHDLWTEGAETPFEFTLDFEPKDAAFAEEMPYWILADFFNSREEQEQAPERTPPPPTVSHEELQQQLRGTVVMEKPYTLGDKINIVLGPDEGTLLACEENPYNLKEVLLCVTGGLIYELPFSSDGKFSVGSRSVEEKSYISTKGNFPNIVFARNQEIKGEKLHIEYQVVTDKEQVLSLIRKRHEKLLRKAGGYKDEAEIQSLVEKYVNKMRKQMGI